MCVYCAFNFILSYLYAESDKGLKGQRHEACNITQFCQTVLDSLFTKYCNHSWMSSIQLTVLQYLLTNFPQFMKS